MKNLIILFLFASASLCSQNLETPPAFRNSLKLNPFTFIDSEFQMHYEYRTANGKNSISLFPSLILKNDGEASKEGVGVGMMFRFYLSEYIKAPNSNTFLGLRSYSFYSGVFGHYLLYKEDYRVNIWDEGVQESRWDDHNKDINAMEGGAVVGVAIGITKRIIADFFVGGGIRKANVEDTFDTDEYPDYYNERVGLFAPEYTGVKPKIGFLLGLTF